MRVSIITGGGIGIGAAIARRLAASDQSMMLHGQGADAAGLERLNAVAADCRRNGAKVEICSGDLAKSGAASELVRAARAAFGAIDAIVHAAGFADRRSFVDLPRLGLERSFAVMAAAFHEMASAALPDLSRGPQDVSSLSAVLSRIGSCPTRPIQLLPRPRRRWKRWSNVWRSNSPPQGQRLMSSCPALRARKKGAWARWTPRPGKWPPRPTRLGDWPNPTRWRQRLRSCCRRRPGTSRARYCRSMAD